MTLDKKIVTAEDMTQGVIDARLASINVGDFTIKTKRMTMTCPALKKSTTIDRGITWDKYIAIFAKAKISDNEYEHFNSMSYTSEMGSTRLTVTNAASSRFNNKEMVLYITYEE